MSSSLFQVMCKYPEDDFFKDRQLCTTRELAEWYIEFDKQECLTKYEFTPEELPEYLIEEIPVAENPDDFKDIIMFAGTYTPYNEKIDVYSFEYRTAMYIYRDGIKNCCFCEPAHEDDPEEVSVSFPCSCEDVTAYGQTAEEAEKYLIEELNRHGVPH